MPKLVGMLDGKPLYSIDGFTDWGQTDEQDAKRYAEQHSTAYCKTESEIIRMETTEAHNLAGMRALRWTAIYTCDRLN